MNKSEVLESMNSSRDQTLKFFDLNEDLLEKNYGEGKWTIRQILHHLTDAELIFHYRLKRIIAERKPMVWAYDQDRWSNAFSYSVKPLKIKKQLYASCRELNIELIKSFFDQFGDREFVHSETGLGVLKNEFQRISEHNFNHIQQIQKALGSS